MDKIPHNRMIKFETNGVIARRFSKEVVAKLPLNSSTFVLKRSGDIGDKIWRENELWFRD